jgi:hypothetical protein
MNSQDKSSSDTLAVFEYLQAEYESAWIMDLFVPPPIFPILMHNRSAVLYGESGTGKTTLRYALENECMPKGEAPVRLIVRWIPPMPLEGISQGQLIQQIMREVFDACAQALVEFLGNHPQKYWQARSWVKDTIRGFIQCFLTRPYAYLVDRLEDRELLSEDGKVLLRDELAKAPAYLVFSKSETTPKIIASYVEMMKNLQVNGTWVLIEGIEAWVKIQMAEIENFLKIFFSTLSLFENTDFAFKLFLPGKLEHTINQTGGIDTKRVDVIHLDWSKETNLPTMVRILEKRMAFAGNMPGFSLTSLTEKPEILLAWLQKYSGASPRGWLEQVLPVFQIYLAQETQAPLSQKQLEEIIRQHTARLRVDMNNRRVFIGNKEITNLEPGGYRILAYMYQNYDRVCTRQEIYYLGYQGLDSIPKPGQPRYQSPNEWRGTLDTALWRLRNSLAGKEPGEEEKAPSKEKTAELEEENIYLVTFRNKGIQLINTA